MNERPWQKLPGLSSEVAEGQRLGDLEQHSVPEPSSRTNLSASSLRHELAGRWGGKDAAPNVVGLGAVDVLHSLGEGDLEPICSVSAKKSRQASG